MGARFDDMPPELMDKARWLLWRRAGGRKVPYRTINPKQAASPTNPATWAGFIDTRRAYQPQRDDGVGFALNGDGLAAVDIDGNVSERAIGLLADAGCAYIERSPSGKGLHGWGYYGGDLPRKRGVYDGINVEIYNSKRYMSVTGDTIRTGDLAEMPALAELSNNLGCTQETQETQETQDTQVRGCFVEDGVLGRFLPKSVGTRNKQLFELARHLKAKIPGATKAELRAIVKRWHELALPTIGTQDFAETWGDFMRGWAAVRFPEGAVLDQLLDGVEDDEPPAGLPEEYGDRAQLLVNICRRLQHNAGDEPFFLSARTAGERLGVYHTRAARLLHALVADDVIECVTRGRLKGKKASEYRWIFDDDEVQP